MDNRIFHGKMILSTDNSTLDYVEVVKYVVHCTTSGVTAAWYYTPDSHNPTLGSLKRALTTSFGSICFGALLISVIKTLRAILRNAARENRRGNVGVAILICMARCMLSCIDRLAELFNEFGFAYVINFMSSLN